MKKIAFVLLAAATLTACTHKKKTTEESTLTRREKDSIIGESALPGAQGVRGALRIADSAAARQERAAEIH